MSTFSVVQEDKVVCSNTIVYLRISGTTPIGGFLPLEVCLFVFLASKMACHSQIPLTFFVLRSFFWGRFGLVGLLLGVLPGRDPELWLRVHNDGGKKEETRSFVARVAKAYLFVRHASNYRVLERPDNAYINRSLDFRGVLIPFRFALEYYQVITLGISLLHGPWQYLILTLNLRILLARARRGRLK